MIDGKYTQICFNASDAAAQAEKLFEKFSAQSTLWADCKRAVSDAKAWAANESMSFTPDAAFAGINNKTVLYLNPKISKADWATPAKQDATIKNHIFYHA